MKQSGAERAGVRMRVYPSNDTWDLSPTDPTGPRFRIEDIYPCVDGGRYPVKRIAGESVEVWADIFREGHDVLAAALLWRPETDGDWRREPMRLHSNDRWQGHFTPPTPGWYLFALEAWTDQYATWRKEFHLKQEAGQDVAVEAQEGHNLLTELMPREREARRVVETAARKFASQKDPAVLLDDIVAAAIEKTDNRPDLTRSHVVPLVADRERARAGAWYEMVPRSQGKVPGKHGTFDDCIARLPEIAGLGFDVLYFTPIHPIGHTNRKGKNNRSRPARTTPAASMPSATSKAATTPSIPSSAPSTTSAGWSRLAPNTKWKWRSTSPSSARPTTRG